MIVDGTYYDIRTNVEVVRILESLRASQQRVAFIYGDATTGRAWGDVELGRIGRSTGTKKIPLVIHNIASTGGGSLLDACVIGIRESRAPHRWLYKHPKYNATADQTWPSVRKYIV